MTEITEKLKSDLASLSREERAEIAYFLLLSLEEGKDEDVEAAWDAELARRMEEIKSGKALGDPPEKVFAKLRQKYP